MLKRLRGTPIIRHDAEWGMVYTPTPPYEILQTASIDFPVMQRLRRFSRYWDLVANSGNFIDTTPLLWTNTSPFRAFLAFSDWLFQKFNRQHGISLQHLAEAIAMYLRDELHLDHALVAQAIWADYQRGGRVDCPDFLRPWLPDEIVRPRQIAPHVRLPKRQLRHLS